MEKNMRVCPFCNAPLKQDSLFCKICGAEVKAQPEPIETEAKGTPNNTEIPMPVIEVIEEAEELETDIFAEGLPQWSLEPPQVLVRRKRSS